MPFSGPAPLALEDDLSGFRCGVASLDDWLIRRARPNHVGGASRVFILKQDERIAGYYALASGGVSLTSATGRFRRNMPDPIPVAILGRLAVDTSCQGQGVGRMLFQDAAQRVPAAAEHIGIRGMLIHAVSEEAKAFFVAIGLEPSPLDPMVLMATMQDIRTAAV